MEKSGRRMNERVKRKRICPGRYYLLFGVQYAETGDDSHEEGAFDCRARCSSGAEMQRKVVEWRCSEK